MFEGTRGTLSPWEGAEEGRRSGVDGGVGGVAGMREVLRLESMVGHGQLLNVACKGVLVMVEAVAIGEGVLGALDGKEHVLVGVIDEYLEVELGRLRVLELTQRGI